MLGTVQKKYARLNYGELHEALSSLQEDMDFIGYDRFQVVVTGALETKDQTKLKVD